MEQPQTHAARDQARGLHVMFMAVIHRHGQACPVKAAAGYVRSSQYGSHIAQDVDVVHGVLKDKLMKDVVAQIPCRSRHDTLVPCMWLKAGIPGKGGRCCMVGGGGGHYCCRVHPLEPAS